MDSQTILVTGAAGFIGSHVSEALLRQGRRVVGIDNYCDFYDRRWKEANVAAVKKTGGERFTLHEADITDAAAVSRIVTAEKPARIIHLAAMAGVRPSIERPAYYAKVNVEGTANLLTAAVAAKVGKFIFASSSSVYGNQGRVPFSEDDPVNEPISPYAATKKAGEMLCHSFWHLYKLPIACLRFFTVYGPRQRPDLAIQKFMRLIDAGKPLPVFGDGSTSRDYTFIEDIVAGVLAAADRAERFHVWNLGGSDPVTLSRLIAEIEKAVGKPALTDRRPAQPGDVERTFADLTHSRADLGYSPRTPIHEGLAKMIAWYRENKASYPG